MARSKTAQPKHSLRKIAVVVATAVSGMSVYAQAAVEPKEDTITAPKNTEFVRKSFILFSPPYVFSPSGSPAVSPVRSLP